MLSQIHLKPHPDKTRTSLFAILERERGEVKFVLHPNESRYILNLLLKVSQLKLESEGSTQSTYVDNKKACFHRLFLIYKIVNTILEFESSTKRTYINSVIVLIVFWVEDD